MRAAFVRDGDVLSRNKLFIREMIPRLIVMVAGDIVVECPLAAGAVNEMAKIIRLSRSKPRDPAGFAMLPPHPWIEPTRGIQWSDKHVSYSRIAKGVLRLPREFEPDLAKARWQACVQNSPGLCLAHGIIFPSAVPRVSRAMDEESRPNSYSRLFMKARRSLMWSGSS